MGTNNQPKRAWIVVHAMAGIPVQVKAYRHEKSAKKRERIFRKEMHPENDETGIFEIKL